MTAKTAQVVLKIKFIRVWEFKFKILEYHTIHSAFYKKWNEFHNQYNATNLPVGQVLDEDESHKGGHEDQVRLLQPQRAFPVDADHAHNSEVPHGKHLIK